MKRSLLSSLLATAVFGAAAVALVTSSAPATTVHAQGKSPLAPGQQSAVGTWFGVARPCPAVGDDVGHHDFCEAVCGLCAVPEAPFPKPPLPPEVPMMPTMHADGTVTVNDAGSIEVFHTTAQGAWAADPDPTQPQFEGKTRLQASFIWLQGAPTPDGNVFVGAARPRFVTYWDPKNPDNMIGYIQPHFFPIVNPVTGLVDVLSPPQSKGLGANALDVTNHYPAFDPLAKLPEGCTAANCLGTYHFTIHRVKANVPN